MTPERIEELAHEGAYPKEPYEESWEPVAAAIRAALREFADACVRGCNGLSGEFGHGNEFGAATRAMSMCRDRIRALRDAATKEPTR